MIKVLDIPHPVAVIWAKYTPSSWFWSRQHQG